MGLPPQGVERAVGISVARLYAGWRVLVDNKMEQPLKFNDSLFALGKALLYFALLCLSLPCSNREYLVPRSCIHTNHVPFMCTLHTPPPPCPFPSPSIPLLPQVNFPTSEFTSLLIEPSAIPGTPSSLATLSTPVGSIYASADNLCFTLEEHDGR